MLKTLLCFFIGLILFAGAATAQAPSYAFLATSGTYTPIAGTPVIMTYNGSANNDDGIATPANAVPIGFTFNYNGTNYTLIRPCADGFASFSTTALTNNTDTWTNNLTTGPAANQRPILAPLWDDLDMVSSSNVTYALSGSSPNQVLTIQWANAIWEYSGSSGAISFQIKLYETTNVIEFVYRQEAGAISNAGDLGASIGITTGATGSRSFLSLSDASASPLVSQTVETTNISTKPATGQIYRWSPYCSATINQVNNSETIKRVQFGTIDNSSPGFPTPAPAYEDFTNISTTLQPSVAYPITLTLENSYALDKVYVWIDFNHNGIFTDAGELVYTSPTGAGPFTSPITIPALSANVLLGQTRMRIRLDDTGSPPTNSTPCGVSEFGQIEDYTINIQNCSPVSITTQPPNTAICNSGNGTITVGTSGSAPTYQWQISTNGGATYTPLTNVAPYSGVTTGTLTITAATLAMNGYLYRVQVSNACSAPILSTGAVLSINTPAAITTNPTNQTACAGTNASMSVVASGGVLTYQWQVSTDGGTTFNPVAGATSSTLTLSGVTTSMNLNRYRVVVTVASCNSVTSSAAILNVNALPTVTLAATPVTQILPGVTTTLTATSSPAAQTANSYSWTLNGITVPGANTNTLIADVNTSTGLGTYKATVTDVNGCVNSSGNVVITALSSGDKLFIYPNPSPDGQFQVRLYSQALNDIRTITIYNSQGAEVIRKVISVTGPYVQVNFDLRGAAPGIYMVHVTHRYISREVVGKLIIK